MKLEKLFENTNERVLLKTRDEIAAWLDKHGVAHNDFKIGKDLSVEIIGHHVTLTGDFDYIPFNVTGIKHTFFLSNNSNLKSLVGLENVVPLTSICTVSIISCPQLSSLNGLNSHPNVALSVRECASLTDLNGCPETLLRMHLEKCENLKSFKGAPKRLMKCLTTLKCFGIKKVDAQLPQSYEISLMGTGISSLSGINKFASGIELITFDLNQIKSSALSLLKIRGLKSVRLAFDESEPWTEIVNKYLPEGDLLDCQEELIDAGLEEYAQL